MIDDRLLFFGYLLSNNATTYLKTVRLENLLKFSCLKSVPFDQTYGGEVDNLCKLKTNKTCAQGPWEILSRCKVCGRWSCSAPWICCLLSLKLHRCMEKYMKPKLVSLCITTTCMKLEQSLTLPILSLKTLSHLLSPNYPYRLDYNKTFRRRGRQFIRATILYPIHNEKRNFKG